jgi:hypothetical protein
MLRRKTLGVAVVCLLLMAGVAVGQLAKVYPGAKKFTPPDTEETRAAAKQMPEGTTQTMYFSDDAFDKVTAFYAGQGKAYTLPGMERGGKLPNGQVMKVAFFIFDGADSLGSSKSWAKVQRPYVGGVEMKDSGPEYKDIRDVTAITVVERK